MSGETRGRQQITLWTVRTLALTHNQLRRTDDCEEYPGDVVNTLVWALAFVLGIAMNAAYQREAAAGAAPRELRCSWRRARSLRGGNAFRSVALKTYRWRERRATNWLECYGRATLLDGGLLLEPRFFQIALFGTPLFIPRYLIPVERVERVWLQAEPPWGDGVVDRPSRWRTMMAVDVGEGFICYMKLMNEAEQMEILSSLRSVARLS